MKRRAKSATNARDLIALERATKILELRKKGLPYRAIGKKVGCAPNTVGQSLKKSFAELRAQRLDLAEDLLELELARLDKLIRRLEKAMTKMETPRAGPDGKMTDQSSTLHNPANALRQAIAERAKLLGLYQPEKHETTVTHEVALSQLE